MTKEKGKARNRIMKWLAFGLLAVVVLYFAVQGIRCIYGLNQAKSKLSTYDVKVANLSYGAMTYVDEGEGEVILSVHGLFGGYDQAYENVIVRSGKNRVLAPSRFGYLGSDAKGEGSPKDQADAYVELLDQLGIDQVFILGTSAGGTPAIRFALDYPERVKGLILYCSAMPVTEKPESFIEYQAPP